MVAGRAFFALGVAVLVLAVIVFAAMLQSIYWLYFANLELVQYAEYSLQARLLFQILILAVPLVPAAFLIQIGRQRIRRAEQTQHLS